MSDNGGSGCSFGVGLWLLVFLLIKLGGTALAAWSWWWVLLPIVPDLIVLLKHFGMLS